MSVVAVRNLYSDPMHAVAIRQVSFQFEDFAYRTPIKFGGAVVDRVTMLNVSMTVEAGDGRRATGFGSMPLGNVWAWPSQELTCDQTLTAMKSVAASIARVYESAKLSGHPVAITHTLEPVLFEEAREIAPEMPLLAILVVASAFDAALHDSYGKLHSLNCYKTYGPDHLPHGLAEYLGPDFAGETLDQYLLASPQPSMPLYHLIGALDQLTAADVVAPIGDGLPETLEEWIVRDGLTHLKIKLSGDDLAWDIARVVAINRIADDHDRDWHLSLDFNERCPNVETLLELLQRLREQSPRGFDRVQYIEQPTSRDLRANPANAMHAAAAIKPVVIDESLVDLETLHLARERGYSGVAFKACKGQTQTLLLAAAAQKMGLFLCVQDLTCPGASLIHSAGLAAHIPGVAAIEANSRQYCPAANAGWDERFPGVFTVRDGVMNTGILDGLGLGAG